MLMKLPNEIIFLVAEHPPTPSLNELSLASKATCDKLYHELYKRSANYEGGKWEHPLIWAVQVRIHSIQSPSLNRKDSGIMPDVDTHLRGTVITTMSAL